MVCTDQNKNVFIAIYIACYPQYDNQDTIAPKNRNLLYGLLAFNIVAFDNCLKFEVLLMFALNVLNN